MSLTQRFGAYLHGAMQAIRQDAERDYVQGIVASINTIAKVELHQIFTEMVQEIQDANYSADIEAETSYFRGGYKKYAPLSDATVERKSYYSGDSDMEFPLKYRGYFKRSPDALHTVLETMSHQADLANRLFEAFGGYSPRTYQTENREVAINTVNFDRKSLRRRSTRVRWSDVVDPKLVAEIRRNADRYVFERGDITKTGFYDAINKRHISLERAIAEGRVKHPVRIRVESKLFQAVEDSEYGFTTAIIPVIALTNEKAANKVRLLWKENNRNFIDIFFSSVFQRVVEKLRKLDKSFLNYSIGEL